MIELDHFILVIRRWAWLIIFSVCIGMLAGFITSSLQTQTYEASTKLLVSNELHGKNSEFAGLTNPQLVLTYVELLKTKQLRDAASEKIGVGINSDQVKIQQVPNTQIINILIESSDPERAANIANTMALTLIETTNTMRAGQFVTLEDNLTLQIEQAKKQIAELQQEYDQAYGQIYQDQLSEVNKQLADIQDELSILQSEIANLTNVGTVEGRAQLAEKEARITQLQSSFKVYDEIRANLLVLGKPTQGNAEIGNLQLQQMKSTMDLYQKIYLGLLSDLETTRSSRAQQTPNAVQIQKAFAPDTPVHPGPIVYTLLGGVIGLMLVGALIFILESLKTYRDTSEVSSDSKIKNEIP